jgi:hypothetical protein
MSGPPTSTLVYTLLYRWFGIYYGSEVGEVMFTEEYREPTAYAAKNFHGE